jgi:PAS domain S-box-containing protein
VESSATSAPTRTGRLGESLRNLSVRVKLKAIILVASGTAMVLSCAAFCTYDVFSARAAARQRLETLAQVVANQSMASLSFGDQKSTAEILAALSAEPSIDMAAAYTKDGVLLAKYFRGSEDWVSAPAGPPPLGFVIGDNWFLATLPVYSEKDRVGTISLRSTLRELSRRLHLNLVVVFAIILGATGVSLALASRFERAITGPVLSLSEAAQKISKDKNYSIRANKIGEDELGLLTDSFNEMLGEIQTRDLELGKHREQLEKRVRERTAELTDEIERRERAQAALVEREEQYRDLVELSPDAILLHMEGIIVFANSAAGRLLGAGTSPELVGRSLSAFVHPEFRAAVEEEQRRLTVERKEVALHELKFVRMDGKVLDIEAAASPFKFGGKPAAQLVFRDVTKRKEVDRLKSEFISTVSHELRTPLTSIRGSLGLIGGGALGTVSPAVKSLLDIANSNAERLVRLINDILDIEKIAAGKMQFTLKPVEISAIVEQSVETNRAYGATFGVSLELSERLPGARVMADQDRLSQVIANLLSNASKFSPKGERVQVSIVRRDAMLRIAVRDRGPGIPDEFRSRIFQKFAQADSSDTRQKGGTGLGLSITKALVERMGGQISFETATGKGTTFYVDLPEYREPSAVVPGPETTGRQVLIVEDDRDVALLLRMMMEQMGHRADVAYTASQARVFLSESKYDAMTLDLMLPDEGGISLLHSLRKSQLHRNLPVIVVSAKATTTRRELEGTAISVVDWIEKPINEKQLTDAIFTAMSSPSGARPRILHVEDDRDIREIVSINLRDLATVVPAATLEEAKRALAAGSFDLALLDLVLPDGWGLELAKLLAAPGRPPIPIVIFSALDTKPVGMQQVVASLVKSQVSHEELLGTIRSALGRATLRVSAGTRLTPAAGPSDGGAVGAPGERDEVVRT